MVKVLFVYGAFENLGLEYLSAVLKENGVSARLVFDPMLFDDPFLSIRPINRIFNYRSILIKQILEYNPDLIAFSVVGAYYNWAISFANEIKKHLPAVHITMGGIHPASLPEKVLLNSCVDSVILGEGEYPLLELAKSIEKRAPDYSIKNIWFKNGSVIVKNPLRPYIKDLDLLPFPDKELFYNHVEGYKRGYTIITRRGCLNSCSYCHSSIWQKLYPGQERIRLRSAGNVIQELKNGLEKYNFKRVRINDDLFTYNKEWLKDFSREYKRYINKPVYCFTSPSLIDEEVVQYLKDIKCYQVCLGVQSPVRHLREDVLNRKESNDRICSAISILKKNKIRCVADTIMGLPGESEDDLLRTAGFFNEHRPHRACVFWLVYFPGTPIVNYSMEKGILSETLNQAIDNQEGSTANTLHNKLHPESKIKYQWLILFAPFLPKSIFKLIINKKLYRWFPKFSPSLLESFYTIIARDRLDIPRIRYYIRFRHFTLKLLRYKIKRLFSGGN